MAVITYTTLCPECQGAGAENRLMGSGDGPVYCGATPRHDFDSIDNVLMAQAAMPAPEPVPATTAPQSATTTAEPEPAPEEPAAPETPPESPPEPAPEPPEPVEEPEPAHAAETLREEPAATDPLIEDLELPPDLAPATEAEDAHDGESAPETAQAAAEPIPTNEGPDATPKPVNGSGSAPEPPHGADAPSRTAAPGPSIAVEEIAGGEARFLNVKVGEIHYVALKAEAENQGQSVGQYFQDQIDRAMENRWLY